MQQLSFRADMPEQTLYNIDQTSQICILLYQISRQDAVSTRYVIRISYFVGQAYVVGTHKKRV